MFANITVINYGTTDSWLNPYPDGEGQPDVALTFQDYATTALGSNLTLPQSGSGKVDFAYPGSSGSTIDVLIDVIGYYTPSATTGAFTPAAAAPVEALPVAANTTVTATVAGVAGVPAAGSGISALAVDVQSIHSGPDGGDLHVYPDDQPASSSLSLVNYTAGAIRSNFATLGIGGDGGVKIWNNGPDPVTVYIHVEGWYTSLADQLVVHGQNVTQRSVALQAQPYGTSGVIYEYRAGLAASFAPIPIGSSGYLADSSGNTPSSWPIAVNGGSPPSFTAYNWDLTGTLSGSTDATLVQVEACYGTSTTDPNLVCTMPNDISYAPGDFGDSNATSPVGPGALSLLTGDYQVSATDASAATSLDGLSVGRSLTTLKPAVASTGASGVFGPGWTADLSGPDAGEADLSVTDGHAQGYLGFTDPGGWSAIYQATSPASAYPITFTGIADAAGDGETVTMVDATTITMADSDGTLTTWKKSGTPATWRASTVAEPGSHTTTSYAYNSAGLVTRVLAPTPAGLSSTCTDSNADTTPGCRSLVLVYGTVAGATRLTSIATSLPQTSGTTNKTTVATYDYNTSGQLADAFDPRVSPHLLTAYTYTSTSASARLATLTQPGINPWSFGYDSSGRLSTVSQTVPVTGSSGTTTNQTATNTIVYGVPNSAGGSNQRPDLTKAAAATWDETLDLPVDGSGTAIFSPDHTPAGTTVAGVADADWPYATLHYLDVNGREVNTADYGAGQWLIDTTQYDTNGNDIWDLSAGNRAQALTPTAATDSYVAGKASPDRANLLASTSTYNPLDPTESTDTYGPTHPVRMSDGTTIDARTHASTVYDEGAPNNDVNPVTQSAYRLPTTMVADPFDVQANTDEIFPDANVIHDGYDAVGSMSGNLPGVTAADGTSAVPFTGWNLGKVTSATVQMGKTASANDLTTTTVYDTDGRTVEQRLPGDTGGTTPRATKTTYYSPGGASPCGSATYAGLTCQSTPGGQPGTGAPLPTTTLVYNQWGETVTNAQTYGTGGSAPVRTVTDTYDAAGRLVSSGVGLTNAPSDNTALPTVTNTYDPATGQTSTSSTGTGANLKTLTTAYDAVGDAKSYTDSTGATSTAGYDLDGRPVRRTDDQGTMTWSYDSSSEHRGLVTGEDIGVTGPSTFAASYDTAGNLSTETYPGGLTATSKIDNAGNRTALTYTKSGATLLAFTQTAGSVGSGDDHTVAQSSAVNGNPYSDQIFTDDPDGRLTNVTDNATATGTGGPVGCTTRQYTFDADSNRTKLVSNAPASAGACGGTATTTSSNYDAADRLTSDNAGGTTNTYAYDPLGRTNTLPAGEATGSGSHNGTTGNATLGYYSNDMSAGQAQGSSSIAFALDPDQDRILTEATTTGGGSPGTITVTNHYGDDTDSPSWTATLNPDATLNTQRYLVGIDGGLDATYSYTGTNQTSGTLKLDLSNLHGDLAATITTSATSISSYSESTEYGQPRNPVTAPDDYGYLGAKQRSANDLAGLSLMGVRLYNSATGRFLSRDPVSGGNRNDYTYPLDPVNKVDLNGEFEVDPGHGAFPKAPSLNPSHKNKKLKKIAGYIMAANNWTVGLAPGWLCEACGAVYLAVAAVVSLLYYMAGYHALALTNMVGAGISAMGSKELSDTYIPKHLAKSTVGRKVRKLVGPTVWSMLFTVGSG